MAVNVNTPVASRVGSAVNPLDLFRNATQSNPAAIPDPRADVMGQVGAIPRLQPSPEVERGIPVLESQSSIETPQDLADATGAPYAPQADREVVLDENGMPVIDPETGEKQYREIGMEDQNRQFQLEQQSHFGVKEGVRQIATGDRFGGQETLFNSELDAAKTGWGLNARDEQKLETRTKTLDSFIQGAASDLEQLQFDADNAVFGGEFGDSSKAHIGVEGGKIPVGYKVMADAGVTDPETRKVLSLLTGLAFNQALTQAGVNKDKGKAQSEEVEGLGEGQGKDYQSNMINATAHALAAGVRRMGLKLGDGATDLLAKAIVTHNQNEGHLIPTADSSGKVILEASPDLKRMAMQLQRVSEAVTNDVKRKGASTVPTASGASFTRGRPGLTKGAVSGSDVETKTADIVKGILGAVAQVFRAKDVKRKELELSMVLDERFVFKIDNRFAWSTHPLAKRNNLHQGAYDSALHRVRRPLDFRPGNPADERAFAEKQKETALSAMSEIRALVEFDMRNIKKSAGQNLYSHWIHSTSNQRFYPNSYNTDYMGSKNVIRDVMGLADQDTVRAGDLFDPKEIAKVQEKARAALTGGGQAVQKKLEELSPNDLGAIGAMRNAVMFYYSALEPGEVKNITKYAPLDVILMYTPQIGARLADLGQKYNAYLADPKIEPDNEMMSLWAAADKGEALGTLNLWDDFYRAKTLSVNPVQAKHSFVMTHHAFSDGNQNGIFLQALFFGLRDEKQSTDSLLRTSVAEPKMDDMRLFGMDTMVANLKESLKDNPEALAAWTNFFYDAINAHPDGRNGVAKDFFKKPLMQNAYGKDASMFTDVLMDLLEVDDAYASLAKKYFLETGVYPDMPSAGADLAGAVEGTLRSLIDSSSVNMMKRIGRFGAITNNPFRLKGVSGDTMVIVPVGAQPVNKSAAGSGVLSYVKSKAGEDILIKTPQYLSDILINPDTGEEVELPTYRVGPNPSASRGIQYFWDRKNQKFDEFHNALGSMQSRQFAVLTIQAIDGDLVKYTALLANKKRLYSGSKDRRNPWPVLFVHDSIIGTPGSSLIYDHVYNNVAIPAAIPHIADMGRRIQNAVHLMVDGEKARVEKRSEPVGIGARGDYPALGALFDEIYNNTIEKGKPEDYAPGKVMPNDYKGFFLRTRRISAKMAKRKNKTPQKVFESVRKEEESNFGSSPEQQWEKKKAHMQSILKSAQALGWVYPEDLNDKVRELVTIPPENFAKMLDLAGEYLKIDEMKPWTNEFARRVNNANSKLVRNTREKGILQIAAGGGKAASKKGYNPTPVQHTEPLKEVKPNVARALPDLEDMFDQEVPF